MMKESNRREFLTAGAALGGALALGSLASNAHADDGMMGGMKDEMKGMMGGGKLSSLVPGAVDKDGNYVLPPLAYPYEALEAAIDAETMLLHHDKHHVGYVKGLIAAEAELAKARESGDYSLVQYWSLKSAFNGGGHFLHSIFWDCMGPDGGGAPAGDLAKQIDRDFGSAAAMTAQFQAAAKAVEGSGWGILAWSLPAQKLIILQGQNQQLLTQWAIIPLLVLDVWEHAYYLRYKNNRGAYVEAFPKVIDWKKVAARYEVLRTA